MWCVPFDVSMIARWQFNEMCLSHFFRELPHEAKHFVIRLLFVEQPVPQAVISSWIPQAFVK